MMNAMTKLHNRKSVDNNSFIVPSDATETANIETANIERMRDIGGFIR